MYKVKVFNVKQMPTELANFTRVLPSVVNATQNVDRMSEAEQNTYYALARKTQKEITKALAWPMCSILLDMMDVDDEVPKTRALIEAKLAAHYDVIRADGNTFEEIQAQTPPSTNGFSLLLEDISKSKTNGYKAYSPLLMTYTFIKPDGEAAVFDVLPIIQKETTLYFDILKAIMDVQGEKTKNSVLPFMGTEAEVEKLTSHLSKEHIDMDAVMDIFESSKAAEELKHAVPSAIMN